MRRLLGLLTALFFIPAYSDTVVISWDSVDDGSVTGYRVYEYIRDIKVLRYEGLESSYSQVVTETTVFGVATYNDKGESEIIPRAVVVDEKPNPVSWTITIEPN